MRYIILLIVLGIYIQNLNAQPIIHPAAEIAGCGAPFLNGVASGDPLSDRIIIWTRVTPTTSTSGPIKVKWRMAKDTGMTQIIKSGTFTTDSTIDFTVKVDVTGLQQNTYYYYDFQSGGKFSVQGRTHTMPSSGTATQRFAMVSCQNWEDGYFNVYNRIVARNDISAVIFLGDYIYEYKTGDFSSNIAGRKNNPLNECITLKDYRTRYAQYHGDADIIKCHQLYPWMIIWDDHEFANDAYKYGAENHQPNTEGSWDTRKANAQEAWREWMPVRLPDANDNTKIYRKMKVGNLINFYMLDARMIGRDKQPASFFDNDYYDTARYLLGPEQMNWLLDDMETSTAKWNIICQQDMVAPCDAFGIPVSLDSWDGYPIERNRLIYGMSERKINNGVILTGDFHTSWGNDLPKSNYDPFFQTNSAGVEFVTTSATSQNFSLPIPTTLIQILNPHVRYVNIESHGYMILNVSSTRTTGEWYYVKTVTQPSTEERFGAAYYVQGLTRHLEKAAKATPSLIVTSPLPKACPGPSVAANQSEIALEPSGIPSVYPNPFNNQLTINYTLTKQSKVAIRLTNLEGKVLITEEYQSMPSGKNLWRLNTDRLQAGPYILNLLTVDGSIQKLVVKQ